MGTVLSFIGYFFIACMLAFIPAMIITSVFIKKENNVKEFLIVLVICALAFELYDQPYKDKKEERVIKSTAVYEQVEDEFDDYEKEPEETFITMQIRVSRFIKMDWNQMGKSMSTW